MMSFPGLAAEVGCVAAAVFCAVASVLPGLVVPHTQRPIPKQKIHLSSGETVLVRDATLDHALVEETVPGYALVIIVAATGLILAVAATLLPRRWGGKHEAWPALTALFVSLGLCTLLTNSLKLYAGFLRPNFYAGCGWSDELGDCSHEFATGRRSWPSGHSSSSFAALGLLSLYLLRARRAGCGGGGGGHCGGQAEALLAAAARKPP